jgi:hypothetical protein
MQILRWKRAGHGECSWPQSAYSGLAHRRCNSARVVGMVVSEEALGRSPLPSVQRLAGLTPLCGGANLSAMIDTRLVRNRALDYGRVVTCGCPWAQR